MENTEETLIHKMDFKKLALSSFCNDCITQNEPILITNIFDTFPSLLSKWSIEYLVATLGNKVLSVQI